MVSEEKTPEHSEMQVLAMDDMDAAGDRLYVAAKRYVAAFDAGLLWPDAELNGVNLGTAQHMLSEAVAAADEATARLESVWPIEPPAQPEK